MRLPELLAPAGSFDALLAAVAAGANAVYTGLGSFNARAANTGLSHEELALGCALAHAHGVRVYVTLNVFVHDSELNEAVELARCALKAGADALIVADAGLCLRLREALPGVELHLSTQAGVQCAEAVEFTARELGVDRVTCARELSVEELAKLAATGVPIEAFMHGAICICYSGCCSYSALMRGRSANRGDCTQPCRLAYELQDAAGNVLAGGKWTKDGMVSAAAYEGDRLLCPRDYLGIEYVEQLVAAGIASLKIEGRMKGADYVYNVVRCYRTALDALAAGHPLDTAEIDELEAQLARSFSRGFTSGYLQGTHAATGAHHMSFERAINQGLYIGSLVELGYDEVVIELTRAVSMGDTLEIRSTPSKDAPADVPKRWPMVVCPRDAAAGERLVVHCKRKVELGSAVHVVRSAGVINEAQAAVAAMRAELEQLQASQTFELVKNDVPCRISADAQKLPQNATMHAAKDMASYLDLGEVCRADDVEDVNKACAQVKQGNAEGVICRNLGQIAVACKARVPWKVAPPLQVWNARTAFWLLELGAQEVAIPEELSADNLAAIRAEVARMVAVSHPKVDGLDANSSANSQSSIEDDAAAVVVATHQGSTPLMITEHCLLTAEGPCSGNCPTCKRRLASQNNNRYLLELDRKSSHARLRVVVDQHGRTRLYR